MRYLSKLMLTVINKRTIESHGGNFLEPNNYLNETNIDYLLEIVQSEMFGEPLYPNLSDKAGLYMYNIIANHIFQDGNKRTGLEAGIIFLRINGFNISQSLSSEDIYNFTIKVASGRSNLDECQAWFASHIVKEYLQNP